MISWHFLGRLPSSDIDHLYSFERYSDMLFICQVLNAGDDMVGLEQLEDDADQIALDKARRSMGSMSAMSGANGMVYMEYRYSIS